MPEWRLGTMGFGYQDWSGPFYPQSLKPGDYLSWYSRHFDSVELDTTFYATPPADRVKRWADATPTTFRFCAKAPREITHRGSIDSNISAMVQFVEVVDVLGEKLGVVLLQFPPSFGSLHFSALDRFLRKLPAGPRLAVEFRDASWHNDATRHMLEAHKVAWVFADYSGDISRLPATTDFLYVRWVGVHRQFRVKGREAVDVIPRLQWWKEKLASIVANESIKTVWGFFNDDYSGYSIAACDHLRRLLELDVPATDSRAGQGLLFK